MAETDPIAQLLAGQHEILERLDRIEPQLKPMAAKLDGLPTITRALTVVQQELRALKAAFNDFARTNVTTGEIEALHEDINRVMAQQTELETRLATLERLAGS
jgi:prefoldin subunit 5